MRYILLAKLCIPRKIVIPKWYETRRKTEKYKNEHLKDIDRAAVSGRLRYWRIQKGVSATELDELLGFAKGTYHREFGNPSREPSDVEKIKSICKYLDIGTEKIFDEYLYFMDSDYTERFLDIQERLGFSKRRMAREIGVGREVYREWVSGRKRPTRTSFEKIKRFLKKYRR